VECDEGLLTLFFFSHARRVVRGAFHWHHRRHHQHVCCPKSRSDERGSSDVHRPFQVQAGAHLLP
ncbi:unnamed protein product, partial [Ectocarpus sp. 4 AP-2014]